MILHKHLIIILLALLFSSLGQSQNLRSDTISTKIDTLTYQKPNNSSVTKKEKPINLMTEALYEAEDSLIMDKEQQKAYLYQNAMVSYDGIELKANYIMIDFKNNTIYATGLPDSSGKMTGLPVFKEQGDEYQASTINYNFNTKKGIIANVRKEEGDVYVFLQKGKKMQDDITYVESGHFTTCSAEHPHYRIRFKKGKIIPNDKIVTGPIYMEIEDIPIPLVLPFGFIPFTNKRSNGVLFPSYGYTENRGYNLTDGGYYWGLGSHADLALRTDIYTRGSWGLKALTRYNFRYRGNGSLSLKYAFNKLGETDTENYTEDQGFFVVWLHNQDQKANPYSNFSANVNLGSTKYNKLNSTNTNDYLTNTFHSSISYSAQIGNGYNLTTSLNHNQNSQSGLIEMTLPQIAFSTPRYYPLASRKSVGPKKWYEKVMLSYKFDAKNTLSTVDSLFKYTKWEEFKNGIQQSVPISSTIPLGSFTWTNSINLTERWYFQTTNKSYQSDTIVNGTDTINPQLLVNKIQGFKAAHDFSFNSAVNTRIYGMYLFTKGPVVAARHVLTPNLGFSFRPDFGAPPFDYYQEYIDASGNTIRYSIFEGQIYGSPADGKSGNINLNFDNSIELKVRSKKDTISGTKKIKLIESLSIGTSYNLAAKEFALAPLSLSARTTLYKGLSIRYSAYWDFYGYDSTGTRINEFNWNLGNPIFTKKSGEWNLGFSYDLNSSTFKKQAKDPKDPNKKGREEVNKPVTGMNSISDFSNAWSLNLQYTFRYTKTHNVSQNYFEYKRIQSLGFRGSVNLTKKWKIGATSSFDFDAMRLAPYTSIDIYRDLHCWEMLFNWIPAGQRRSYNLTIRVKSSMLQDLKVERKRDWRDY